MNLVNYNTTAILRPATLAEYKASLDAATRDGGAGVIEVDGVSCYVEGEPLLAAVTPAQARRRATVRVLGEDVVVLVRAGEDVEDVIERARSRVLADRYGRGSRLCTEREDCRRMDGSAIHYVGTVVGPAFQHSHPVRGELRWIVTPGTDVRNIAVIVAAGGRA